MNGWGSIGTPYPLYAPRILGVGGGYQVEIPPTRTFPLEDLLLAKFCPDPSSGLDFYREHTSRQTDTHTHIALYVLDRPFKDCQSLIKFCQIGEISPNLVTLIEIQPKLIFNWIWFLGVLSVSAVPVNTGDLTYIKPWNSFVADNKVIPLSTVFGWNKPIWVMSFIYYFNFVYMLTSKLFWILHLNLRL